MKDVHYLESPEDVKTFMDRTRIRIFADIMGNRRLTVKQIATELDQPVTRVHYHVKELERIGVLEVVDTNLKRNLVERLYSRTAGSIMLGPDVRRQLRALPPDSGNDATVSMLLTALDYVQGEITRYLNGVALDEACAAAGTDQSECGWMADTLFLDDNDRTNLHQACKDLFAQYHAGGAGKKRHKMLTVNFPDGQWAAPPFSVEDQARAEQAGCGRRAQAALEE